MILASSLVGRAAELDALARAWASARADAGMTGAITGEPGIGKTRLAETVARAVVAEGGLAAWGRCWEAGGAPACWPWVEVLRGLAGAGPDVAAATSAALGLLEGAGGTAGDPASRFRLADAVASALRDAARIRPLLVVLDDLHAADATTAHLFAWVTRGIRASAVCLVGTWREAQARVEVAEALADASRAALVLSLRRLDAAEVADLVRATDPVNADLVAELYATSEGNPLFISEILGFVRRRGRDALAGLGSAGSLPDTLRLLVDAQVGRLPAPSRDVLVLAAAMGRDFDEPTLADAGAPEARAALRDAAGVGLVVEVGPGRWRFTHALHQAALLDSVTAARRAEAHLALARALDRTEAPWSVRAHHYREAGERTLERAAECARRAAVAARGAFAFEAAAQFQRDALAALAKAGAPAEQVDAAELELADALIQVGRAAEGQDRCRAVGERRRAAGDGAGFARAALVYGKVIAAGRIDPVMVVFLADALALLPEGDSALRAEVTARYAAALQPARDPTVPMGLARDAIAMARRLGDVGVLVRVLHAGISALMDLAAPSERVELNREHARLAAQLGERVQEQRAHLRLVFDQLELLDVEGARASAAQAAACGDALGLPIYRWSAPALAAFFAAMAGDLPASARFAAEAHRLADEADDPRARVALALQDLARARAAEDPDATTEARLRFAAIGHAYEMFDALMALTVTSLACRFLDADAPPPSLPDAMTRGMVTYGDGSVVVMLAEVAWGTRDAEMGARVLATAGAWERRGISWGLTGMWFEGDADRAFALAAAAAGRWDEADARFARHVATLERWGARGFLGRGLYEQATARIAAGRGGDAEPLLARVVELAQEIGQPFLLARARALLARAVEEAPVGPTVGGSAPSPGGPVVLTRDGETWRIRREGREVRLKDSKGLHILATLVASPGREFHAEALVGGAEAGVGGHAGEALDAEALAAYRRRLLEIEEDEAEAEAWNDAARAEKLREEREFLLAEVRRATGLGGRIRRSGDAAERARINVQRRVRDVIERTAALDPALGQHLQWAVKTGTFCRYDPPVG